MHQAIHTSLNELPDRRVRLSVEVTRTVKKKIAPIFVNEDCDVPCRADLHRHPDMAAQDGDSLQDDRLFE